MLSDYRRNFHDHELHHLIMAVNQKNLVYNHDFRYFSNAEGEGANRNYGVPDGYQYQDSGGTGNIGFEEDQLVITTSNDGAKMVFKQALHEFPRWQQVLRNQTVTACIHLDVTAGSQVSAILTDGISASSEVRISEAANEMVIELQLFIDAKANELTFQLQSSSNAAVIKISKIYANIGHVAVENLPCMIDGVIGQTQQLIATANPPATQLSLCKSPIELSDQMTRLNSVLNGRFGVGVNDRSLLPDVRGYFMRSWDNGAGTDPNADDRCPLGEGSTISGDMVGTIQPDIFKEHHHTIEFNIDELKPSGDKGPVFPVKQVKEHKTSDVGGDETRPKNVYELYTIKWA